MTKLLAWLGVATLTVLAPATAHAGDPLKPYVVLILDTSGSMVGTSFGNPTGFGPPSCGGADTKLNHATCAINRITNSYGDMVIGLARFRASLGGTISGTFPNGCCMAGPNITAGSCTDGPICVSGQPNDNMFQLLSPLVDGDNQLAAQWTNGTANTCSTSGSDPEIWDTTNLCTGTGGGGDGTCGGGTPIDGSLRGAKRYFLGQQATDGTLIWPSNQTGFDPIRTDPTKTAFLPTGSSCNPAPSCTTNCCAEQCRPYVVIMLTDGEESCFGDPTVGAASLLATDVDNRRYRIETKAIGFGVTPGLQSIENIAHAGGAQDVATVNEGFYAQNEAELQLAISSILDDTIKTEQCNNLDDDCDIAIDEDFPGKGNQCDNGKLGVCRRTGTLACRVDGTGLSCTAPVGPNGTAEVCNTLDDDCDGKVDEGLTNCICIPQGEQCNGDDDDCDTRIDEGIPPRPCNNGTCQGIETCTNGSFAGTCTAQQPGTEVCNGLDDNCDGVRDGFVEACSNLSQGFPTFDPRNNPGHPTRNPIPENQCQPGNRTCPANIGPPNNFGACLGEIVPRTEVCNGLDDDCDNEIDEDTGGADCSSACGIGTTACTNGQLECDSVPQPDDDTCDGNDDDCDGLTDEDYVCDSPPNCECSAAGQCNAVQSCVSGVEICVGAPIAQESCNCEDDNCNGIIDDGAMCGDGETCTAQCQCALPCSGVEFPCPDGKFCKDNFCVTDPCFEVVCPPVNGNAQTCVIAPDGIDGGCVDACSTLECAPLVCIDSTGTCEPDDCTTFPERCEDDEVCVVMENVGECIVNLCQDVTCPAGQYCLAGSCHGGCADVVCPDGERCKLGVCEPDPCGGRCLFPDVCNDNTGQCVDNFCSDQDCLQGQWCNPNNNGGTCEPDPCFVDDVTCPDPGEVCLGGSCELPATAEAELITTGGGGGCASAGGGGLVGAGLMLLFLLVRRRRA